MMKLLERIKAKTPRKDRKKGQLSTIVGTGCAIVLAFGLVANPIGIAALTLGATIFGSKAIFHAQKVQK